MSTPQNEPEDDAGTAESGPLMDPDLPPSLDPTSGTTPDESPDAAAPAPEDE